MADYDEGPSRRLLSRGQKRSNKGTTLNGDKTGQHKTTFQNSTCSAASNSGDHIVSVAPSKVSPLKQSDWFSNSFNSRSSRTGRHKNVVTSPSTNATATSSSKSTSRKPGQSPSSKRKLRSSDAFLAEIDIENLSSATNKPISHTSEISHHKDQSHGKIDLHSLSNRIVENSGLVRRDAETKSQTLKSERQVGNAKLMTTEISQIDTESVYFPSKFGNYKGTQSKVTTSAKKEVMIENCLVANNSVGKNMNENDTSTFSFSFVGDDTQFEVALNTNGDKHSAKSIKNRRRSSEDKDFSITQVVSMEDKLEVDQTSTWNNKEVISSTQYDVSQIHPSLKDTETQIHPSHSGMEHPKYQCTHYERHKALPSNDETLSDLVTKSQFNESCFDSQNVTISEVDTTALKGSNEHDLRYRCTPFKRKSSDFNTQPKTQTDNSNNDSECLVSQMSPTEITDVTQLKGTCDGNEVKYRCTPFKTRQDTDTSTIGTQLTQSQFPGSLVSGTQFRSYIHDTGGTQGNTQGNCGITQMNGTVYTDTQVHSRDNLCDMTGVLVDSQDAEHNMNTSNCDMFSDSFHDDDLISQVDELDQKHSQSQEGGDRKKGGNNVQNKHGIDHKGCNSGSKYSTGKDRIVRSKQKKRSLDDDLDSIVQEAQKRRSVSKREDAKCAIRESNEVNSKVNHLSKSDASSATDTKVNPTVLGRIEKVDKLGVQNSSSHISAGAVSFGSKNKTGSGMGAKQLGTNLPVLRGGAGSLKHNVQLGTNLPVTPGGAGTLQQKIKQRLKQNAGQRTPKGPGSLVDQLREQVLERVQHETAVMKSTTTGDVGPFYGLPSKVKTLFENNRGIKSLYDWQDECLRLPSVLARKNLIYCLPTSGGKTLVAEILILQELLCHRRDALLILPFVSIVQEKVRNMSQFAVDLDFHVEEYAGSKGRFPPVKRRKSRSLYIATMEKAHSIVNSLIDADRLDDLGLVVVDELHMIGEGGSRGATLETTLLKCLHAKGPTQIIGMSATLNNIDDLKQFLQADEYNNDFRPVTLTEHMKLADNIYKINSQAKCVEDQFLHDRICCFQYPPDMEKVDPDHLLGLVLEVIPDNSCLVFCSTKKNCENVALMLCKLMVKYKRELSNVHRVERKLLLKELYNDSEGQICPVLQYTLHFGVAYHHSGLTVDERKLIEEAYSAGTLCLLACTSTLAAGVNLPAKRVILRNPYVGQYFISRSQYKQMVGRAGRAGIDSSGESILICKPADKEKVVDLLGGPIESCHSSLLYDGGKGLRTLILSTVGLKLTTTTEAVFTFISRSLATIQQTALGVDVNVVCQDSLQKLIDAGLVLQTKSQSEDPECQSSSIHSLEVTELGKATFKGPIDVDYANRLYKDLQRAEEPMVISNHLHLLFLVTPYDMVENVTTSWFIYFNQMNTLTPAELKVASLIGVPESYIARRASQQKSKQKVDEFVVIRFYLTLMLYDLWRQKSVWDVAAKFQQSRGFVQNLLSSAASFASCVAHFCQEMEEFWAYRDLMGNFVKRLSYCVTSELLPLVEIPGVKLGRAKLIYNAGYKTLSSVANVDPHVLVKAVQYLPTKVAKQIVASAKLLLNEKAEAMMEEVEQLVSIPEGHTTAVAMATIETPGPVTPSLSQGSIDGDVTKTV